jgi:AcrR family transcriptional regulator
MPAEERRSAIIAAALPLLLERGANVTSKQIAEAAGVAEGTIFGVFRDKDAVVHAAVEAAFDPAPTERALAAIDPNLPFEQQLESAVCIMQQRVNRIWRLVSSVGDANVPRTAPHDYASLASIFAAQAEHLRVAPEIAAQQLRALTMALSHPVLISGEPLTPAAIVSLLLDGIRSREASHPNEGQHP